MSSSSCALVARKPQQVSPFREIAADGACFSRASSFVWSVPLVAPFMWQVRSSACRAIMTLALWAFASSTSGLRLMVPRSTGSSGYGWVQAARCWEETPGVGSEILRQVLTDLHDGRLALRRVALEERELGGRLHRRFCTNFPMTRLCATCEQVGQMNARTPPPSSAGNTFCTATANNLRTHGTVPSTDCIRCSELSLRAALDVPVLLTHTLPGARAPLTTGLRIHPGACSMPSQSRRLVSMKDAAAHLGCHYTTVQRRVADGSLPTVRVGRSICVDLDALETMSRGALRPSGPPPTSPTRARRTSSSSRSWWPTHRR